LSALTRKQVAGRIVVVIDVLRAGTTLVTALAHGCRYARAFETVEAARQAAARLGRHSVLMGGERNRMPIPGFDCGNSPVEYTRRRCRGKVLILTTTNGTKAIARAAGAKTVLFAALCNAAAVADCLVTAQQDVTILAAGTDGEATLEDIVCAGAIVERVTRMTQNIFVEDAARIAVESYRANRRRLLRALRESYGGRELLKVGMDADIRECAKMNTFDLVPVCDRDGRIGDLRSTSVCSHRGRVR
jgi:2-phosphosulfolactate phosphatase